MKLLPTLVLLSVLPFGGSALGSAPPTWWHSRGVTNLNPPNDRGPVVLGQAKWVARQALREVEERLLLGASPLLRQRVGAFLETRSDDYAILPVDQLKDLARSFHQWLESLGFAFSGPALTGSSTAPLTGAPGPSIDPSSGSPASVGQLKAVFDFELSSFVPTYPDRDGDGYPDWLEMLRFGCLEANSDHDGDGICNWHETLLGLDPTDPHDACPDPGGPSVLEILQPPGRP